MLTYQQDSQTQALCLDPSWETNPDLTILLWICQTCEGLSLPLPWLRTNKMRNVLLGNQQITKERQGHDRCWSSLSPFGPHDIRSVCEDQASFFSLMSYEISGRTDFTLKEKREDLCMCVFWSCSGRVVSRFVFLQCRHFDEQ